MRYRYQIVGNRVIIYLAYPYEFYSTNDYGRGIYYTNSYKNIINEELISPKYFTVEGCSSAEVKKKKLATFIKESIIYGN